ncbi:MAG: KamA family radical SAM protein [bacterium]
MQTRAEDRSGADAPLDWRWQLAHRLRSAEDLASRLRLTPAEREAFAVDSLPPVAVTPYYLSLMDPADPRCPIRRQALPHPEDVRCGAGERVDPLGERERSPVPGVIHRYPDRVVLLASTDCPVRCRHCNRRARSPSEFLCRPDQRAAAVAYVQDHTDVREVILSGGDPLTRTDAELASLLAPLWSVPHVEVLRIHTRAPVTCPMRITDELLRVLRGSKPLFVLTQFNHPREVTAEAQEACARLVDAGHPVANQSVLLRGINSDGEILKALSRALLRIRVRPYYLFQLDPVVGTERFRTPVRAGLELVSQLRGQVSGLGIPTFALDAPGGFGKVAVAPEGIVFSGPGEVRVRTWQGQVVSYPDTGNPDLSCPPWREATRS